MTPDDVIRGACRLVFGPWVRGWRRIGRRWRRVIKVVLLALFLVVAGVNVAYAGDGSTAPSALSWITYTDSHDLSLWDYEMSIDRGGARSPGKVIWGFFIDLTWELYRAWVSVSVWLVGYTFDFEWLEWITGPVNNIAESLHHVVGLFGVTPTLLTITGVAALFLAIRGKLVTAAYEIVMSLVIVAMASGVLANPVAMVADPHCGALVLARDFGFGVASGLGMDRDDSNRSYSLCDGPPDPGQTNPAPPPDQGENDKKKQDPPEEQPAEPSIPELPGTVPPSDDNDNDDGDKGGGDGKGKAGDDSRQHPGQNPNDPDDGSGKVDSSQLTGMLIETFLREPLLLVNYGGEIPSECVDDFDEAAKTGDGDDLRNAVKECEENDKTTGEDATDVAENPNSSMFMSLVALYPTAFFVLFFVLVLCGVLIYVCAYALYQALKMIIALVIAPLPSAARGMLWLTLAELVMAALSVIFVVVFLATYLLFIEDLLAGADNMSVFYVMDLLLLIGVVIFLKTRARIKASAARFAAMLAKRPGEAASPASIPQPSGRGMSLTDAYHLGDLGRRAFKMLDTPGRPERHRPHPGPLPGVPQTQMQRAQQPPPSAPGAGDRAPVGAPKTPAPATSADVVYARVKKLNTTSKRVGDMVRLGSHAAAAAATGGTSTVVTTVGKETAKHAGRHAVKMTAERRHRQQSLRDKLEAATVQTSPNRAAAPGTVQQRPGPGAARTSTPSRGSGPSERAPQRRSPSEVLVAPRLQDRMNQKTSR